MRGIAVIGLSSSLLIGCTAGTLERADTFSAAQLNKRQESKLIEVAMIEPVKVQVNNKRNQEAAELAGALLGALAGSRNDSGQGGQTLVGAALGGTIAGSIVSDKKFIDGVSLTYIENGTLLTSAQVGKPCEFAPGPALVITTSENETRVQPNSIEPCTEGRENIAGTTSKMAGLAGLQLQTGSKDRLADLERQKELLDREREVMNAKSNLQKSTTGLRIEEQRTKNAARSADQEIEARDALIDRTKSINEGIRSVSQGVGKGAEKGIVGTTVVK